jgi:hypothetical protein
MARPPKPINWEIILKRMQAGNTAKQIAFEHEIHLDTFYDRFKKEFDASFSDYSANSYEGGNGNIAYTQYMKALSGNVQMLIWLGKVRLGQREPDATPLVAPNQDNIDKDHHIMHLEHQIALLKEKLGETK